MSWGGSEKNRWLIGISNINSLKTLLLKIDAGMSFNYLSALPLRMTLIKANSMLN